MTALFMWFAVLLSTNIYFSESANILGVFILPSFSHQITYQPIWKELSLGGHQVTVMSPNPICDPNLINLTEINTNFIYHYLSKIRIQDQLSKEKNPFLVYHNFFKLMDIVVEEQMANIEFQNLIKDSSKKFDLILIEYSHPVMFALGHRFKAPIIGVTSLSPFANAFATMGTPALPVLYPDVYYNVFQKEVNIWERFSRVFYNVITRIHYQFYALPKSQKLAQKYISSDVPFLGDIEQNTSMVFLSMNPFIYGARAQAPAVIITQFLQVNKKRTILSQDLQDIVDTSTEGVIYFSLGSNVKSIYLAEQLKSAILSVLSKLPYKVLWKYEEEFTGPKPKNVIFRKWLPQQSILAHPNVKAFITQGGLQSIEEAISSNVPMLGLPFMADQASNLDQVQKLGLGIALDPFRLTQTEFHDSLIEVITNQTFKENIRRVSAILQDNYLTGLEKVVWWSEYVIRHKGAHFLRSPTAAASWSTYLIWEVLAIAIIVCACVIWFCFLVLCRKSWLFCRQFKL